MIEDTLGDGSQLGCRIHYSAEQEALETGGGIYKALPLLVDNDESESAFLLVNGDVWLDWECIKIPQEIHSLCHLWLVNNPEHNPVGDFVLTDSHTVLDKGDPLTTDKTALTFSGISLLKPALFNAVKSELLASGVFPLAPLLRHAMAQGYATGEVYSGYWVDVGTPARLQQVEDLLTAKQATKKMAGTL
jgi:MurNAc alpha-1-phosphate uridylyltransferase